MGGLIGNVELATHLRGTASDEALEEAWRWAEEQWNDDRVAMFANGTQTAVGRQPT